MAYVNNNRILTVASIGCLGGHPGNINIIGEGEPIYRPNGGDLVPGDTWWDGEGLWIWNGSEWILVNEKPHVPVQIFSEKMPTTREDGTSLVNADRWYDLINRREYVFYGYERGESKNISDENDSTLLTGSELILATDDRGTYPLSFGGAVSTESDNDLKTEGDLILTTDSLDGRWMPVYSDSDALLID
jgi:hypothetical protein